MFHKFLFLIIIALGINITLAIAENAPTEKRVLLIPAKESLVETYKNVKIGSFDEFAKRLTGITAEPSLRIVDKIDSFYLLLKAAGLDFDGSVMLEADQSYDRYFGSLAHILEETGKSVMVSSSTGSDLRNFAVNNLSKDKARAGYALVLSAVLEPTAVDGFLAAHLAENSKSSFFLHMFSLAGAISNQESSARLLVQTMNKTSSEEGLEDLISAISYMDTEVSSKTILDLVGDRVTSKFDLEVETGLLAIKSHMSPEKFNPYFLELKKKIKDPKALKRLQQFEDSGFRYSLSGAVKFWDGFSATMYDDGCYVTGEGMESFRSF